MPYKPQVEYSKSESVSTASKGGNLPFTALLAMYILVSVLIIGAWVQPYIPLDYLFRDVFAVSSTPVYYGFFSNVGVLVWCATTAICFLSTLVLSAINKERDFTFFFLASGVFTFLLTVDDFFMIHEEIFPNILSISEKIVFLGYTIFMSWYAINFRKVILKTNFKLLLLSLFFMFLSVASDAVLDQSRETVYLLRTGENFLIEDGFKLLGIVTWLFYFVDASATRLKHLIFAGVGDRH